MGTVFRYGVTACAAAGLNSNADRLQSQAGSWQRSQASCNRRTVDSGHGELQEQSHLRPCRFLVEVSDRVCGAAALSTGFEQKERPAGGFLPDV